jgi:hypothetical protein
MWWQRCFAAPKEIMWEAAREVILIGIVALAPILVSILVAPLTSELGLLGAAAKYLLQGQLFLYAMSFCGSILWRSSLDGSGGQFPPRPWFILFCFIAAALTFAILAVDPTQSKPKPPYISWISFILFVGSLFLYWVILVMQTMPPPTIEQTNLKETENLEAKFDQLGGK